MFDEKVKAIPIEELIKRAITKRMNQANKDLSKTMYSENFNQPVINLQTTIDTNTNNQGGYRQRTDTTAPVKQ